MSVSKKIVVLVVDENEEPVDLITQVPVLGTHQVLWKKGVPNPNADYEAFKQFVKEQNRKLNPHLFDEEGE